MHSEDSYCPMRMISMRLILSFFRFELAIAILLPFIMVIVFGLAM